MSTYRAAIIGCGRMARGHVHGFLEAGIPGVAGADILPTAREKWRAQYGPEQRLYTAVRQMRAEVRPELGAVVTPEQAHCAAVVACAEAGVKGIICEKPLAMDLTETSYMADACRLAGAVLTVSHQRHYSPQYTAARELIEQGAIGKVQSCVAISKYQCMMTDACHTIHMMLDLMGWPRPTHLIGAIDGNSDYVYFGHRAEDFWSPTGQPPERWLVREVHGAEVKVIPVTFPKSRGDITLEIEDLIRSIETGAPHPLDATTRGRTIMEVMIGIYESARRRGVVHFPVQVPDNPFLAMVEAGVFPR